MSLVLIGFFQWQNVYSNPILNQNSASSNQYEFFKAKVVELKDQEESKDLLSGKTIYIQKFEVEGLEGNNTGKKFDVSYTPLNTSRDDFKVNSGDELVIQKNFLNGETTYNIQKPYRLNNLLIMGILFIVISIFVIGKKAIPAIIALIINVFFVGWVYIPLILIGYNAFWLSVALVLYLSFLNVVISHGINRSGVVIFVSVSLACLLSAVLSIVSTEFLKLYGVGSEEAFNVLVWNNGSLNLKDIFQASILIGTLGVLDDIASAQASSIEQISLANPNITFKELFTKGYIIGREHIISMINTLALAYVSVSLPLIIGFVIIRSQDWWVTLNDEIIIEEMARTFVGSICLILSVPLCNFLATWLYSFKFVKEKREDEILINQLKNMSNL